MTPTGPQCALPADVRTSARRTTTVWQTVQTTVGGMDAAAQGLGGFTFDVQHAYDPIGGVLFAGDGTRRATGSLPEQLTRFAGTGWPRNLNDTTKLLDNVRATSAHSWVTRPAGLAFGPDGSLYLSEANTQRIRRVLPSGLIVTVAGSGNFFGGFSGDGGPATSARLNQPLGLGIGPDGGVYFVDRGNLRIRKVNPSGIITTVAGTGAGCSPSSSPCGDGGPASAATFSQPNGLAVGPDGSVYIADEGVHRIRQIQPNGLIVTAVGQPGAICQNQGRGYAGDCGEGVPGPSVKLRFPRAVALGLEGSLYFSTQAYGYGERVRRMGPDGLVRTVAGSDAPVSYLGDGGPALAATLNYVWALTVGPDGTLYVGEDGNGNAPHVRVRRVRPDGLITTAVGDGTYGNTGNNGPALRATLKRVQGLATGEDGALYLADNDQVRRVSAPLPGLLAGTTVIASEDGSELYVFSAAGRLLLTLDALTRDTIYNFGYNAARQLVSIRDRNGRVTEVERDSTGRAVAMVAPNGQRTVVDVDAAGNVAGLTGPDGRPIGFQIAPNGLMGSAVDQIGDTAVAYHYDADGRVVGMTNALGGTTSYDRATTPAGSQLTVLAPTGEQTVLELEDLVSGAQRATGHLPDGTTTESTREPDGRVVTRSPNGQVTTLTPSPDPRLGMQAPLTTEVIRLPSGLARTVVQRRAVVVDTATNNVVRQFDSTIVNGRVSVTTWDGPTRRETRATPQGRIRTTALDAYGRASFDSVPGVLSRSWAYDGDGRVTTATHGARAVGLSYDELGHLERLTDPLGHSAFLIPDELGRPTRVVRPTGSVVDLGYDPRGHLSSFTPPGRPGHLLQRGPGGLLSSYVAPDAGSGVSATLRTFGNDGRLLSNRRMDGSTLTFSYDSVGRPSRQVLPTGDTLRFVYDTTTGMLSALRSSAGVDVLYQHDGGLLLREQWTGTVTGSVSVTYDADFRLQSQRVNDAFDLSFAYDGDGFVTAVGPLTVGRSPENGAPTGTSLGIVTTSQRYSPHGELDSVGVLVNGAGLYAVRLARDAAGRIGTRDETIQGVVTHEEFAYDSTGRLLTVTRNGTPAESYEYDANGNRARVTNGAGTATAATDARDRRVSQGNVTFAYTVDGEVMFRIVGSDTTRYAYDALGNLRSVAMPDATHIDYVVDGANRRVARRVGGTMTRAWLYDGPLAPAAELDSLGQVACRFAYATRATVPDFAVCAGVTYRLITDERGSLRLAVNAATGEVALRRDYDAFGRVTTDSRPGFLPFGFGGGLYDEFTGLTRFGARDYDAATGRWTTRDPIGIGGGDANLYAYVGNDPVNRVDVLGLEGTLTEEEFKSHLQGILNGTTQNQLRFRIRRQVQCWAVELVTDEVVDQAFNYGIYLFDDLVLGGLPYAGQSVDIARRGLEHARTGRFGGAFRAVFGVDADTKLREAEQFVLDYTQRARSLGDESLDFVANRRHELNRSARQQLRNTYDFCK